MNNCYLTQSGNHLFTRAFLVLLALCAFLGISSFGVSAYEINGTATGNLLNSGWTAEADGLSVYADTENGNALTIEKNGKIIVADENNAQFINICGETIYYTSINGADRKTELRAYDIKGQTSSVLWSVPLTEGMKNLLVVDGEAQLVTNGAVATFNLETKKVADRWGSGIWAFVTVPGGTVYTSGGDLNFRGENGDVTALAQNVQSFDCSDDTVYYSDGTSGVYALSLDGGSAVRIADGGESIVYSDDLYYQNGETFYSLSGGREAQSDTGAVFSVLSSEVAVTEDAYAANDDVVGGGLSPAAVTTMTSLPDGDYKSWKQQDSRWSGNALGNSSIGRIGCAAVAVSILLVGSGAEKDRYLAGKFDPGVFVREMTANGGFTSGGGMYWSIIGNVYPSFSVHNDTGKGTGSTFYNMNQSNQSTSIKNHLAMGRYAILCVNNSKSGNTHWLAVDYATNNGIFICDPGYSSVASPTNVYEISWYPKVTRAILFNYSGKPWSGDDVIIPPDPGEEWDNPFKDIKYGEWYYQDVAEIYDAGLMVGKSTVSFAPNDKMTRKEFVAVLGRLVETDFDEYEFTFNDVNANNPSQAWFAKYAYWAAENKIMVGDGRNFNPDSRITREEIAAILIRLSNYLNVQMLEIQSPITFADARSISSWAKDDMAKAQRCGIIFGEPSGNRYYAKPKDNATRAQVAAMIIRFTRQMPIM